MTLRECVFLEADHVWKSTLVKFTSQFWEDVNRDQAVLNHYSMSMTSIYIFSFGGNRVTTQGLRLTLPLEPLH
jgi:hypothetical protein